VDLKPGPKLVIDHMITYQLLGMDEFWAALPRELADIREAGREAHAKALQIAMGKTCAGCTSIKSAVGPVHNLIWSRLVASAAPTHEIVDLISAKRGYRPRPISIYFKDETGKVHLLTL